jgi:arylsulfatase A-like enzyme
MSKPVNFLFINPDEMRAESVGCYGHPLSITPNMDRMVSPHGGSPDPVASSAAA